MKIHPPYHLRPNKAVDRLTFFEAIKVLDKIVDLSSYTYFGFGGPYLDEFRILYEMCPGIKMKSFEADEDTFLRQHFHLPAKSVSLEKKKFSNFLTTYAGSDQKAIFWLDFTSMEFSNFSAFMELIPKLPDFSVVKITVRAELEDFESKQKLEILEKHFGSLLPSDIDPLNVSVESVAGIVQGMLQVAAQQSLSSAMDMMYQPLSSFYYCDDRVGMYSLTGVVCKRGKSEGEIKKAFQKWEYANLDWSPPQSINLPVLSIKERLTLQKHLPTKATEDLTRVLGYRIGYSEKHTIQALEQYIKYHRFFPYFVKAQM